jgi:hypothetical protein
MRRPQRGFPPMPESNDSLPVTALPRTISKFAPVIAAIMVFCSAAVLLSGQITRGVPLMIISVGLIFASVHLRRRVKNSPTDQ